MSKKMGFRLTKIILFIILVTILLAFQSCKRDRSSADQPVSLGISSEDGAPSWSPDGKKIAFISHRDGNWEIYTMNTDGSNQSRLSDNPTGDREPSWSPDGKKIAFVSNRDGNWEIYTMNTDGSNQSRLTDNSVNDLGLSWSPDGNRIIFVSYRDRNWEIFTMNADGSDQSRLTDNTVVDGGPSWSPDGNRIVFFSGRDGNLEIYIMNSDGSNPTRLIDNPALDRSPSWSPDGKKIAFFSNRDGNFEIYLMDSDGSNLTRLTNEPAVDIDPSWSPDGQKIAFVSERDFDREVYVMDADGSNPINLTNNAPVDATFGLAPLPRSELNLNEIPYKIVFESYRETEGKENWEICLIDADGSGFVNLTNTPEIDEMYPHASPEGSRVCFVADEGENLESKRRNVYYMNIDGGGRVKIAENAYQPCWSGDGKYIAYLPAEFPRYDPNSRANKGIEIYDLETGEVKQHPNDKIHHLRQLCWSPDGEWFVAHGIDMPGRENAFKADDKTMMRLLMAGCTPDISPDGKQLAWNGTDSSLNIGILDFDSPQSNLTNHRVVAACEHDHWVYHADWSPDSNYLIFAYGTEDGDDGVGKLAPGCNICICDLRTGKWTQITIDGKHNKQPDWVPLRVQ